MALERWRGKTALVTGASAGIGAEFARQLAAAGCHLVITARRKERLDELAGQLSSEFGVQVHVVASDLGSAGGVSTITGFLNGAGLQIDILVNNAGFGAAGEFHLSTAERQLDMIQLNIASLVSLTHSLLLGMRERGEGHIVLVGSVNAFMSAPHFAVYSATKAFVRSFGEALASECAGSGVSITTVHPGATASEFVDVADMKLNALMSSQLMSPKAVVKIGLAATYRRRITVVTGLMNRLTVFILWLMPGWLVRPSVKALYSRLH